VLIPVAHGRDPLNVEGDYELVEWHLLPAMHGHQLRQDSIEEPFKYVGCDYVNNTLLTPAFKKMGIKGAKVGIKCYAIRQQAINRLISQHTGKHLCFALESLSTVEPSCLWILTQNYGLQFPIAT